MACQVRRVLVSHWLVLVFLSGRNGKSWLAPPQTWRPKRSCPAETNVPEVRTDVRRRIRPRTDDRKTVQVLEAEEVWKPDKVPWQLHVARCFSFSRAFLLLVARASLVVTGASLRT